MYLENWRGQSDALRFFFNFSKNQLEFIEKYKVILEASIGDLLVVESLLGVKLWEKTKAL